MLGLAAVVATTTGCGGGDERTLVPPHRLAELGEVLGAAWLNNETIVVERAEEDARSAGRYGLWLVKLSGDEPVRLTPEDPGECRRLDYRFPRLLPDGRVGAVRDCGGDLPSDQTRSYVAIDPDDRSEEVVAPLGPAGNRPSFEGVPLQDFNPGFVSWYPDMKRAVITVGNSICTNLATLTKKGVGGLDLSLPDGHRVDAGVMADPAGSCTSQIRAANAAVSPDGSQVAFAASVSSTGVQGPDRMDQPWDIYLQDDEGRVTELADDVRYNNSIDWFPNEAALLVTGGEGDDGGLFKLDLNTRDTHTLSDLGAGGATVSPDGTRALFVAATRDGNPLHKFAWILDL